MSRLVILDGSSHLTTQFYGTLDTRYHAARTEEEKQKFLNELLRLPTGEPVNAVYGMMKSIEIMMQRVKPTHFAITWDISRDTFRRELYPDYKGHRGKTIPELKSQFELAQRLFKELGVAQFALNGYEADDIIGTLARKFEDEIDTVIWTKDQDAIQLVNERVRLWLITSKAYDMYKEQGLNIKDLALPPGVFEHTHFSIEEDYGLMPIQIIDKKALEGDTSDNIPGVKGVGEKSVVPLLQEFKTLEGIYDYLENNTVAEIKEFFKDWLKIKSSPLMKLMDEIMPHDIIEPLVHAICNQPSVISEKSLATVGYVMGITPELLHESLKALDEAELKKIYKTLGKEDALSSILKQVGEVRAGDAKKMAFLSKELATIKTDIAIFDRLNLSDITYDVNVEHKNQVFAKYHFKSLLNDLDDVPF